MAQAVCVTISLLEVRHPGTDLQSPDQGPTATTRHLDSHVGALHRSLQPSTGPGTPYPSSLGRAAGEAARGSRSHLRASVRRGPVASLGMATPLPWPLSTVTPLQSLSPLLAQEARTPVRRGPRSAHALPLGRGRAVTHLLGVLSLRGPGVGTARAARRTGRGSPARVRSGGSLRLWLAGGEARRGGGRKEVGLGPRRGRKF